MCLASAKKLTERVGIIYCFKKDLIFKRFYNCYYSSANDLARNVHAMEAQKHKV